MLSPRRRPRVPKDLDAGPLEAEVGSFALHMAAEGKAPRTIRNYTEAVRWFAAAYVRPETEKRRWQEVDTADLRRWTVRLLGEYSTAYAGNQFRAVRRFLRWLAVEEDRPDPVKGLRAPTGESQPGAGVHQRRTIGTAQSMPGPRLRGPARRRGPGRVRGDRDPPVGAGRHPVQQRRDAAMIAIFAATGIRLSELAGLRYDPGDPQRSDIDLWHREITVHGKGRTTRTVKISYDAARALDRYLRARARHAQAYRPQLWLGVNNRGPMTASGIYQVISRRGRQCGVQVFPHRFRHHFSHTRLDRGGADRVMLFAHATADKSLCRPEWIKTSAIRLASTLWFGPVHNYFPHACAPFCWRPPRAGGRD